MDVIGIPGDYRIGCILSVPVRTKVGIVDHKGILCDRMGPDELPTVIHNAKLYGGQIIETSMTDYLAMAVGPLSSEGYPGALPRDEVLRRARSQISQPWRPWSNCEHFVAWAHGLPPKSPQMRRAAVKAGAGVGLVAGVFVLSRFAR